MIKQSITKIILLVTMTLLYVSCGGSALSSRETGRETTVQEIPMSTSLETDRDKLATLIQLDVMPQSVQWQTFQKGSSNETDLGPTDWGLVAVLAYDAATISTIQSQLAANPIEYEMFVEPGFVQDWFPEAIRNSFAKDASGDYLVVNQPLFQPALFVKSPLNSGYVFVQDGFVFLYLDTV